MLRGARAGVARVLSGHIETAIFPDGFDTPRKIVGATQSPFPLFQHPVRNSSQNWGPYMVLGDFKDDTNRTIIRLNNSPDSINPMARFVNPVPNFP
jgi:hypothetical protein